MSGAAAARAGAALFALPERGVVAVTGADRVRWLDGMLTCDVRALSAAGPRSGAHGLALTREGRIVAELHVLARPGALLLELEREAIAPLLSHLGRFVVADDVTLRDESEAWQRLALEGPAAAQVLETALGRALPLEPDGAAEAELAGASLVVAAYSLSGLGGRQLLVPPQAFAAARDALVAAGAALATAADLEELRIEAGLPRQGRELTAEVLPAEARLERTVSETKGCYTGQEVVTRMRSRGRVSHLLVGLRFAGPPPRPGTELRAEGRVVGSVTSAVESARLGAIGLGFVRRQQAEAGSALEAGPGEARVVALPFPGRSLKGALLVFAKEPRPGAVKTRLSPPFTAEQAAAFYACLLGDVLEASASAAARLGLAPILYVAPGEACARVAARAPAGFRTLPQRGPDLAARMANAFAETAAAGFSPILLRGSDSPLLGEATFAAALAALEDADLALSPDLDGGYNLVALRAPAAGLFEHAMSTPSVLSDTLAQAGRLGLAARVLEAGFDIDTAADLAQLASARREGRAAACPRTLAFLDRHGLWS